MSSVYAFILLYFFPLNDWIPLTRVEADTVCRCPQVKEEMLVAEVELVGEESEVQR